MSIENAVASSSYYQWTGLTYFWFLDMLWLV